MSMYALSDGILIPSTSDPTLNFRKDLPIGTYMVGMSPAVGYFLQPQDHFTLPKKIYGRTPHHSKRILDTFEARPRSTGVLLEGEKGSGKTLLSTMVSTEARDRGMSTLIVSAPYHGTGFNAFVQSIDEPCVVLYDEFEKVYHQDQWQSELLTLLDGTAVTRKLSILTINDVGKVSKFLRNRPGRIFYALEYKTLEPEFIFEYCEDVLKNKNHIDGVLALTSMFDRFNFDMLKALVEEMNRYGEESMVAAKLLNIRPEYTSIDYYKCSYSVDGKEHPVDHTDTSQVRGHPLNNMDGYEIEFFNVKRYEWDGRDGHKRWTVDFGREHLAHADVRKGVYEYQNDVHRLILTKDKKVQSYWDTIRSAY